MNGTNKWTNVQRNGVTSAWAEGGTYAQPPPRTNSSSSSLHDDDCDGTFDDYDDTEDDYDE